MLKHLMVRAQKISTQEWVNGFVTMPYTENIYCFTYKDEWLDWEGCKIDANTVCRPLMQSDRLGKPIYENDILFCAEDDSFLVARWDNEKCAFVLDDYRTPEWLIPSAVDIAGSFGCRDTLSIDDFYNLDGFVVVSNTIDAPEFTKTGIIPEDAHDIVRIARIDEGLKVVETHKGNRHIAACEFNGKTYFIEPQPDTKQSEISWHLAECIIEALDKEDIER